MHRYPWKWNLAEPGKDAPTVFSTFACGGGSSMGYKRAGFRVVGNCEIDPKIAAVYERNLHPERSYVMDLRGFNELDDLPDELYGLDVLDGSPPCSTFSMAGSREKAWGVEKKFTEGQAKQRLDDLFFTFLDTVEKLQPKVFVAENVTGLIKGNAKGYVNEILRTTRQLGYDVQLFCLNSAFMGVPQRRERVFFIANRIGRRDLKMKFSEDPIPFGEVRTERGGDPPTPSVAKIVAAAKKYENGCAATRNRIGLNGSFFSYSYCWDEKPVPTITATDSQLRMADRTMLSKGDLIAVSSFPQDYDFGASDPHFICGMSVPPSMMANVAHEIKAQWLDG